MNNKNTTYSIKNWAEIFETRDTRRCTTMHWVSMPTKMTGIAFRRIAKHPQGSRIFAAWVLMVEVAANCEVRGVLASNGKGFDAEDMSLKTGFPEADFALAFDFLSSDKVAWLSAESRKDSGNNPEGFLKDSGELRKESAIFPATEEEQKINRRELKHTDTTLVNNLPGGSVVHGCGEVDLPGLLDSTATTTHTDPEKLGHGEAGHRETMPTKPKAEDCPHREIALLWNEATKDTSLPQVRDMTDGRRTTLRGLWAWLDGDRTEKLESCRLLFARVAASAFLKGETGGTFRASFDWTITPANRVKINEGHYDNRTNTTTKGKYNR